MNRAIGSQDTAKQGFSSSRLDTLNNQNMPSSMVTMALSPPVTRAKGFASRAPVVSNG